MRTRRLQLPLARGQWIIAVKSVKRHAQTPTVVADIRNAEHRLDAGRHENTRR